MVMETAYLSGMIATTRILPLVRHPKAKNAPSRHRRHWNARRILIVTSLLIQHLTGMEMVYRNGMIAMIQILQLARHPRAKNVPNLCHHRLIELKTSRHPEPFSS